MKKIELAIPHIHSYEFLRWMDGSFCREVFVTPGSYTLTFEDEFFKGQGESVWSRYCRFNDDDAGLQHALWLMDNQVLIPEEFKGQAKVLLFPGTVHEGRNALSGSYYYHTPHIWCGSEHYPGVSLEWGNIYSSPARIVLVRATMNGDPSESIS